MAAAAVVLFSMSPLSSSPDSGAAVTDTRTSVRVTAAVAPEASAPTGAAAVSRSGAPVGTSEMAGAHSGAETCRSARRAVRFYIRRANEWRDKRSAGSLALAQPIGKPSCRYERWRAKLWRTRSFAARQATERWQERRTLEDFAFAPGADAWPKAVREVQRVFPGTEGWLLSCSAAEGGHGRWVGYGGQGYSTWLRDSDTVGGNLQFRFSTFTGMFRRAVDHAYAHGFRVPVFSDYTAAWRSALGQALAGGWARYTGNDDSHWSASFGRGC